MGFGLKKLLRGAKKIAKVVGRPALAVATGGLSEKAIGLGKGFGEILKGSKAARVSRQLSKIPKPRVMALITKTNPKPTPVATTMPGGAPLRGSGGGRRRKSSNGSIPWATLRSAFIKGAASDERGGDVRAWGAYNRLMDKYNSDGRNNAAIQSHERQWQAEFNAGGASTPSRRRSGRKSAPRRSGGGRRPPTGGLNLKALSASWKAAGKPGTWQAWIAANK